ncbi:MAG: ATP-dependent RecD-like DNA helicase [Candidatus Paceibacterota bacterium]
MSKIDGEILNIDTAICKNIEKFDGERGLLSQNILSQLRNFVEHISLKEYAGGQDIENTYPNIELAVANLKTRGQLRFLSKFHRFLQTVASHYTLGEENSERLMLKYYEYLLRIKSYLKKAYGIEVLSNIDKFPINTDPALQEYYEKIVEKIEHPTTVRKVSPYKDRYYVQKIKPFFVNHEVYYEVTFTIASAKVSKFDRVIAFTKLDISDNYAVKLSVIHDGIEVLGKKMPIQIIDKWEVSIRPCEFDNFADIFGENIKVDTRGLEYRNLMGFLTETGLSLIEVVNSSDDYYQQIRKQVTRGANVTHISDVLDKNRALISKRASGSNVISYLLRSLNNKIIKLQRYHEKCNLLSDLYLNIKCVPFDRMPFNSSLRGHNPKIQDVFDCVDSEGREHELFARFIKNNTENKGKLFTSIKDIPVPKEEAESLVVTYNAKLYLPKHTNRRLENFKDHIYINGYERDTLDIIEKLQKSSSSGISNYTNSVDSWLKSSAYNIDCKDKKEILRNLFADSGVALIYGAAGTGKSTLINHASNFFNESKKLYLANTNPAVDNLRRKVTAPNRKFQTIAKFLSDWNLETEFDLLIIDECSTVSNDDMIKVLRKANFKYLILVGDVFQIESIIFGNWFNVARSFVPETAVFELTIPYRTSNLKLIELWNRVRDLEDNILEHITKNGYSARLDESIFENLAEDEIILCLNYDGLYGINNLNKFLQSSNGNAPIDWGIQTYKINDPILFNETDRFAPVIYNNLKGRIVDIEKFEGQIRFDIEIDKAINELQASGHDFELIGSVENGNSIIRFLVNKQGNTDEDDEPLDSVVPFQVAYAVSIHKAQGLEYSSVKVVITNETEEMITHNIFYTAITRAKEKLKIYLTPETEKRVLSGFEKLDNKKDVALLSSRLNPSELFASGL